MNPSPAGRSGPSRPGPRLKPRSSASRSPLRTPTRGRRPELELELEDSVSDASGAGHSDCPLVGNPLPDPGRLAGPTWPVRAAALLAAVPSPEGRSGRPNNPAAPSVGSSLSSSSAPTSTETSRRTSDTSNRSVSLGGSDRRRLRLSQRELSRLLLARGVSAVLTRFSERSPEPVELRRPLRLRRLPKLRRRERGRTTSGTLCSSLSTSSSGSQIVGPLARHQAVAVVSTGTLG